MKKLFALLLSLGICGVLPSTAHAVPDPTGKFDFGAEVAAGFHTDDDTDDSVFLAGYINYGLNPQWAVGVSGGWTDPNIQTDTGLGTKADAGSVRLNPIFFDVIYRVPNGDSPVQGYFVLGLGAVLANQGGNRSIDASPTRLQSRDEDGFGVKIGGGLDWFVTENLAYTLELAYVFSDAGVSFVRASDGQEVSSLDLDFWYLALGAKYRFD